MFSLHKKRDQKGFTIVELLIVIVVIGILAALVVTTYAGIQAKARDSKRQTDMQALQTQIEGFYASNNYYPSLADINDPTWRASEMKSLDAAALKDPSGSTSVLSGSEATATGKQYGYVALDSSDAACTAAAAECSSYTLTAYLENAKELVTKNNLDG
jgi:prepilin-type N-terminal cleavage/methylation domain-containing protein